MGVLVVADEAGVHDRRPPGDVDHARVGGELREQALGEHAMKKELRLVLQRADVARPAGRLHQPGGDVHPEGAGDPARRGAVHHRGRHHVVRPRQERRAGELLHAEVFGAEVLVPAGERPAPQGSPAGEDRAIDAPSAQERNAGARQFLFQRTRVLAAIHPHLATRALVEPGVARDLVIDAVEEARLERGRAGRRAGTTRRQAVGTAFHQGAQGGGVPMRHRVLELPASDSIQVEQQDAPTRR